MKIIDAHIHYNKAEGFARLAEKAGHENSEAHLRQLYAEKGIAHAVVMGNRSLEPADHRYPDFLSYCIGLDSFLLEQEELGSCVRLVEENLKREQCVGIKLYPGYNPIYVYAEAYFPYYELAERYGKPVAIHTGQTSSGRGVLKYAHPFTVDEAAANFPRVQFVMCHFGNPFVNEAAAVMSKNRNVAADLSGLLEGRPDIPALLEEQSGYVAQLRTWMAYMGDYSRLMYGTDWPLVNVDCYLEFMAALIPEKHRAAVMFDNANRIYGLGL